MEKVLQMTLRCCGTPLYDLGEHYICHAYLPLILMYTNSIYHWIAANERHTNKKQLDRRIVVSFFPWGILQVLQMFCCEIFLCIKFKHSFNWIYSLRCMQRYWSLVFYLDERNEPTQNYKIEEEKWNFFKQIFEVFSNTIKNII